VKREIGIASISARARRKHPSWGDQQLLTRYILHEVLEPERPADALAYLALTASDLWPGEGWNFVFGEANLRQRTGVWSMYRNGNPEMDFNLYLRRTVGTASHELCHILTAHHCTALAGRTPCSDCRRPATGKASAALRTCHFSRKGPDSSR
jgi:archaemetzincin